MSTATRATRDSLRSEAVDATERCISPILNSGLPLPDQLKQLTDFQDLLSAMVGVVAEVRATMVVDIRTPGESKAALARRITWLKADRIADLLARGEALRAQDAQL